MNTKILLVDDHLILREGLRSMLSKQPDFEIIGEAENGTLAIEQAEKLHPHVIVMDVSLPDINGIEATKTILSFSPATKIIALSMHSEKRFVMNMLRAGASGYLLKDCAFEELISAIRFVLTGNLYISPTLGSEIIKDYLKQISHLPDDEIDVLTPKEREILKLLASGKALKEIAYDLNISVKTAETHRQHITEKLGIYTTAELTQYAIVKGVIVLGK
ncbi:MAG: response regulator transcription factor [Ignavibacteriae bacterium]|nr:response regulator transcription factor [Ignavibacteriota bacterium]